MNTEHQKSRSANTDRARLTERAAELRQGHGVLRRSGAFDAARQCDAATKRQTAAALQDAGAWSTALWKLASVLIFASPVKLTAAPAAPEISKVEPFVWVVGATNQITIEGKELANVRGLWTSRHGVLKDNRLSASTGEEGKQLKLAVPIDPTMASGPFALRLITEDGISAPIIVMLENLFALRTQADGVLSGAGYQGGFMTNEAWVRHKVKLKHREPLVVSVIAGQFGSKLDPVLRILDQNGKELAYAQDSPGMGVDCEAWLENLPGGEYVIELRDAQYRSGSEYRYHLRTRLPLELPVQPWVWHLDHLVNNPRPGASTPLANLPDSEKLAKWARVELSSKPMGFFPAPAQPKVIHRRARSLMVVATYASMNASAPAGKARPAGVRMVIPDEKSINSHFSLADEHQEFELQLAESGTRRFTAMSRRLGGERDPVMRLRSGDGKPLKDSHLFQNEAVLIHDFKEPGSYRLEVWDAAGQHGDFGGYHIRIERDPANFELNTETDSLRIPAGGESELSLTIERDGYDGPVKFELAHGPEGVELNDAVAKERSKEAKFKVRLAASLTPGTTFPLKISGRRGEGDNAQRAPLYTSAYWKKRFPDLYSPMFEFEDTVWVTVLPAKVETKED